METVESFKEKKQMRNYYASELSKVEVGKIAFAPTIKVFANGNGEDTKHMDLNKESARVLINWLQNNF